MLRQERTKEKMIKIRSVIADKIAMKVRSKKYVPCYLYELFFHYNLAVELLNKAGESQTSIGLFCYQNNLKNSAVDQFIHSDCMPDDEIIRAVYPFKD